MLVLISKAIFLRTNAKNNLWKRYLSHTNLPSIVKSTNINCSDNLLLSNSNLIKTINEDFIIYENFVSELEEETLIAEIDAIFKRRRYQFDHWDGAIHGYKETEKEHWNKENSKIIQRLQALAFPLETVPLKHIHVLDLSKTGHIKPHIDSIKFCGSIIAGISLLSTSVMRLVMEKNNNVFIDALLKRRSLYIMRGALRYEFTHEIFADEASFFKGLHIPRDRRVSVICRNEPDVLQAGLYDN